MAAYCCEILCLPCKAVNALCNASCEGVRLCCKGTCEAINLACGALCYPCKLLCPDNAPSPIFLSYTWLINVPLLVASLVVAVTNLHHKCEKSIPGFLIGVAVASTFFCAFSVHVYRAMSGVSYAAAQTSATGGGAGNAEGGRPHGNPSANILTRGINNNSNNLMAGAGTLERACSLCMYDPWVFAFMIVALFALVWSGIGLSWVREHEGCASPDDDNLLRMAHWAGGLIFFYLFFGIVVMGCSLFVNCCRSTEPLDDPGRAEDPYHPGGGVQQRPPAVQQFGQGGPGMAPSAPPFNPFAGVSSGLIGRAFNAPAPPAGGPVQAGAGPVGGAGTTGTMAANYPPQGQEQAWSLPTGYPPAPARAPMQPPRGPSAPPIYGAQPSMLPPPQFAASPAPYREPPAPQGYIDLSQTPPPVPAQPTTMGYPASSVPPYVPSAPPMPQYPPPPNRT